MPEINVCSVNIGSSREIRVGEKTLATGFFKCAVSGLVRVAESGLDGDLVADATRHGGRDQAVYLYSQEDAYWWAERLQRDVPPGFFGENLTIERWWPDPKIGDRISFEDLVLEISFPRIPCATLAARVGAPGFVKEFVAAHRPGLYARVLQPGAVGAGSRGTVQLAPASYPSTASLFEIWHHTPRARDVLQSALDAPIAERARAAFAYWLDQDTLPGDAGR